jgi:DMSO/TMAO reductase YedYZ molybdopterin-dependent catalytic subunit
MRRPSFLTSGLLGGLTALLVMAVSYLGNQLADLPFIPFDLFDWLARVLPGPVISFGIDTMVRLITTLGLGPISAVAKRMEQLQGIVIVIVGGIALGVLHALLLRRTAWASHVIGIVLGGASLLLFGVIEGRLGNLAGQNALLDLTWLALLFVGWNVGLGQWLAGPSLASVGSADAAQARSGRRALLRLAGVSLGATVLAGGLGAWLAYRRQATGAGQPLAGGGLASNSTTQAAQPASTTIMPETSGTPAPGATPGGRIAAVPGTRPEVTPDNLFYRIDIDTSPPEIDGKTWSLQVGGLFDHPRNLSLADLMAYPATTQPITLSCISNPVGGDLISTGYWTGVSLPIVLKDLGIRPEAKALGISAEDDYYESVEFQDMFDPRTLLVYGMNGATLPIAHGFPLRIYIPNRYGMKQPKWITAIDALAQDGPGYWVDRGWSAEARPQIVSVIDVVAKDLIKDGRVPIGGIAWAGDRGIQKVEIQVDDGEWTAAVLRVPALGHLTWVQWRYDWPLVSGRHVFRVRATDGTGALQTAEEASTYPSGATGYHSVGVTW